MTRTEFEWRQHWVMGLHLTAVEAKTIADVLERALPRCSRAEACVISGAVKCITDSLQEGK